MPIRLVDDYEDVRYELKGKMPCDHVVLRDYEKGGELVINFPVDLDDTFSEKEFQVYVFWNKNIKESDIFQVFLPGDLRIGWAIPVISLSSAEHQYVENSHYLKYAYAGIDCLLRDHMTSMTVHGSGGVGGFPEVTSFNSGAYISDFFDDSAVLFIVSSETLEDSDNFDVKKYIPSLLQYGYVFSEYINSDECYEIGELPEGPRMKVSRISDHLSNEVLIYEILSSSLVRERNPVFRFFLIYQIFELLIDSIYRVEQDAIVEEVVDFCEDSSKVKDSLSKLQDVINEKKRLGLLVHSYSNFANQLTDLRSQCNELLNNVGRDPGHEFHEFFYRVRNFVFH